MTEAKLRFPPPVETWKYTPLAAGTLVVVVQSGGGDDPSQTPIDGAASALGANSNATASSEPKMASLMTRVFGSIARVFVTAPPRARTSWRGDGSSSSKRPGPWRRRGAA